MLYGMVWRGCWPQPLMCAAVKHRPASQASRWVTTRILSDESLFHVKTLVPFEPTVTPKLAHTAEGK